MATYSIATRQSNLDPLSCICELRTAASVALVYEIGICIAGASSGQEYALGRPLVRAPSVSSIFAEKHDTASQGAKSVLGLTFSSFAPILPSSFLRRFRPNVASGNGSGIIWTFSNGLQVPPNASLCLWNLGLGSALDIWFEWDE